VLLQLNGEPLELALVLILIVEAESEIRVNAHSFVLLGRYEEREDILLQHFQIYYLLDEGFDLSLLVVVRQPYDGVDIELVEDAF